MQYFLILNKKLSDHKEDIIAVKEGFCLEAAILNIIWAIYHKIWWLVLVILLLNITLNFFTQIDNNIATCSNIALCLLLGFHANDIRTHNLIKKGYSLKDIFIADSEEDAKLKYFNLTLDRL